MPGVESEYFTGVFTSLMGPTVGWGTVLTISRATTWSWASVSCTSLTGAYGMPLPSNIRSHSFFFPQHQSRHLQVSVSESYLGRLFPYLCSNHGYQRLAMLDSQLVGGESFIIRPLRLTDPPTQDAVQSVVPAAKQDVAIVGGERLVRHNRRFSHLGSPSHQHLIADSDAQSKAGKNKKKKLTMCCSVPPTVPLTRDQDRAGYVRQRGHLAIAQGHIEMLAGPRPTPGDERSHDGIGGVESRREVGDSHTHLDGRPVALAGNVHESEFGLDHHVVSGPAAVRARLAVSVQDVQWSASPGPPPP